MNQAICHTILHHAAWQLLLSGCNPSQCLATRTGLLTLHTAPVRIQTADQSSPYNVPHSASDVGCDVIDWVGILELASRSAADLFPPAQVIYTLCWQLP